MIGQTISHYKILEKLGEGGMGVVYKAHDTTLDRDVALKFLPTELTRDTLAQERFIQEAKAASALSHPNICIIHAIEQSDEQLFIVMDFIDGQTLRDKQGSVSFKQAIEIGIQVSDGLAAAHEKGIVHRDIKPENIMIRKDGIVQIMDFGLAKLREKGSKSAVRLTKEGSTVGTAGYMSPEQVQGQEVDHRSDIFSLGVLLYELFTGQLPFKGVHETALLYEIVNVDPPPMSSIKPEIDANLDAIVLDCLEKDQRERCQSVAEAARVLRRIKRESTRQHVSRIHPMTRAIQQTTALEHEAETKRSFPDRFWMWGTILFFLTSIGLIVYTSVSIKTSQAARTIRSFIPLPDKFVLNHAAVGGGQIALSIDGTKIAFVADDSAGNSKLWVRSLSALTAQPLVGTEGAFSPFWSPDGSTIGFFADGRLKKIDAAGGTPLTICDAPDPRGGSWNQFGQIVFAPDAATGISMVSAAGGRPTPITQLDTTRAEGTHRWPWFLPDGKHFLFYIRKQSRQGGGMDSIGVGSIGSHEIRPLVSGVSNVAYASGRLLFVRESALMAQPFDLGNLQVVGEAVPIAQSIQHDARFDVSTFSVSQNGVLIYESAGVGGPNELALFDTSGRKISSCGHPYLTTPDQQLSWDGKRIVLDILDTQNRVWILWLYDVDRGMMTRFTFGEASAVAPVWSPKGDRIVFSSGRNGRHGLYAKSTSGSAPEELLADFGKRDVFATSWSADGRYVVFRTEGDPRTKSDLWILPMTGSDRKPVPFLQSESNEVYGVISPDGRWIAYESDESGKHEMYVRPFDEPGSQHSRGVEGKWQISTNGGAGGIWRNDGKGLFYADPVTGQIMIATIRSNATNFEVLGVKPYMDPQAKHLASVFDISADGKLILGSLTSAPEKNVPLTLVVNWDAEVGNK